LFGQTYVKGSTLPFSAFKPNPPAIAFNNLFAYGKLSPNDFSPKVPGRLVSEKILNILFFKLSGMLMPTSLTDVCNAPGCKVKYILYIQCVAAFLGVYELI
jgi:hypothetical protein